jgi:putative membrane protein
MSLMMLVFWALLIVLAVWLVRYFRTEPVHRSGEQPRMTDRADEVLAERFARGEIDEEEFTRLRRILHTTGGRS